MHTIERKICELIWNIDSPLFDMKLLSLLCEIKREWKYAIFIGDNESKMRYSEYLCFLYCFIGYSRDIICGYGERDLSYRMVYIWYSVFPILSIYSLHSFVLPIEFSNYRLPYGSWKDIKYFCRTISKISSKGRDDPLISIMVSLVNQQLDKGIQCSSIAKWIPKETGAFSWVFDRLVLDRDPIMGHKGYLKKGFRLMISSMKKAEIAEPTGLYNNCEYYDKVFIGDYIYGFLSRDSSIWLEKWSKLDRSFSLIDGAVPILILSADITDDILRHMIGYVCLLSRSYHRVLIFSTIPIWLDISLYKDDIIGLVRYLWDYCTGIRTRVNWESGVSFLLDGLLKTYSNVSIKLFFFGSYFDLGYLSKLCSKNVVPILWKISGKCQVSDWQIIPENKDGFLFLSGKTSANMRYFYKIYYDGKNPYSWYKMILDSSRFDRLRNYFGLFCNHSEISLKKEA